MKHLRISSGFTLPLDSVTQTFAILAKRGVGKTHTALVMVEEMIGAGLPVVVVDPIGVCWGLRTSANGKSAGLPVVILGGDRGDVPLEASAGATIADFVIESRQPCVLDLSLFRKGEQVRFMTDFAERLYQKNRAPLHVVLDEADAWAPQRPLPGEQRLLGAIEDLVRRGRARGLGITLVTQRAAVLNKNVLTQIEVLITMRTIAPQDRAAIDEWIKVHGTPEQREDLMESLPSLPIGTAWFWSPGWLDIFMRVGVRKRMTFDSSKTPEMGSKAAAPRSARAGRSRCSADADRQHDREGQGGRSEGASPQDRRAREKISARRRPA
jgi:DNA helicase HerA-like ATPase